MRGFDHAKILSPGFHGLRKERLAQCLPIYVQDTTKNALQIMSLAAYSIPWVPETFLARFPVLSSLFLAASPLVALAYGRRCVGLRPTPKIPAAREKNLWSPGYLRKRD